jgi:arabinan endo-1,5-alpha-L-arabinosidase
MRATRFSAVRVCLLALTLALTAALPASAANSYKNPVYGSAAPDPMALAAGTGDYYAYHTGSLFPILRSKDLVSWRGAGTALASRPAWVVPSGDSHPWAPSVLRDSQACPGSQSGLCYYLYYVGLHDTTLVPSTHCVGVAVSPTAGGPFSDKGPLAYLDGSVDQSGRPPGCGDDNGYSNIDPAPFVDDDGSAYLYVATNRYCAQPTPFTACPIRPTISVIPLAADKWHASRANGPRKPLFTGDANTWEQQTHEPKVEGPWMEKRGSAYYLFYSGGDYTGAYGLGYATGSSPLGVDAFPSFAKSSSNPVLHELAGVDVLSPGGGSMIKGPKGGDWLIYHGRAGDYTQPRTLRVDPVRFKTDGSATVDGPTARRQSPAP